MFSDAGGQELSPSKDQLLVWGVRGKLSIFVFDLPCSNAPCSLSTHQVASFPFSSVLDVSSLMVKFSGKGFSSSLSLAQIRSSANIHRHLNNYMNG